MSSENNREASKPSFSEQIRLEESAGETEKFIQVKNLWKVFGRDAKRVLSPRMKNLSKEKIQEKTGCVVAMRNISLDVGKGEFYILMGLSGSGKSTLIRSLIRLNEPTSGSVIVNNTDVTKLGKEELLDFRKTTYGMVFQHYGLFPHMTVLDNAAYGLKVKGLSKEERLAKAMQSLETVGLLGWEDYYPGSLSGGMQQRVGLARALATDPDILLMDEPFSGLDPLIRRQMQDELVDLQDKLKKTIIFVTHDLHEALKLGDRIAIMRDGCIVQIGTPEQIVTEPADDYVHEFVRDASPAKVLTASSIMQEPEVLLYAWEGPNTAIHMLQANRREAAFVVDKARRLLGVATIERLKPLASEKKKNARIPPEAIRGVPTAREDSYIEELFSIVNANPYPIPVTDENGKLLGIVKTDTIFETIKSDEEEKHD